MSIVFSLLQLVIPCFLVSLPYAWVVVTINTAICLPYGIYRAWSFFRKRDYELPYNRVIRFGIYAECDDNEIVIATPEIALVRFFKFATIVASFSAITYSFFFMSTVGLTYLFLFLSFFASICPPDALLVWEGYQLYFIDGEKEIPYTSLKDFMKRNKLK